MAERPAEPEDIDGPKSAFTDADWERFQETADESVRRPSIAPSGPKEPSARAWMVTARLREQDEQQAWEARRRGGRRGWGRKPRQPDPWQPTGWRTGPAWKEMQGGQRSRRWGAAASALMVFAVGALVITQPGWVGLDRIFGSPPDEARLAAETAAPSGPPPTPAFADGPTLEKPFAGSPAQRWSENAQAIELPHAARTGQVSAERVAQALELTKQYLVAANLDSEVLRGGYPGKALSLIDPLQKEYLAELRSGLRHPSEENDPTYSFTRFDPAEVRLVGDTVKVRGRMTVKEDTKRGTALIEADYSFVYPLRHASGGDEVTRVVARRKLVAEVVPAGGGWTTTLGKIWITEDQSENAGVTCTSPDGLLHPVFSSDWSGGSAPEGPVEDPYDRSRDLDESEDECGVVSRV